MTVCTVRLPPLDEVARRWGEIELALLRATARTGCYEPIDCLRAAMAGQMAIWLIEDAARLCAVVVTELRQYPRKRVLDVLFIAGDELHRWTAPLLRALDVHARACGCVAIVGWGRPGWARFGFAASKDTILVREITP